MKANYEKVELIDTTDGKFMSRAEAATMLQRFCKTIAE